ncbi:MAG: YncE family protein [Planctomycetota bacterium]|nr:YncE family protein [Planctomycetota bacterium]
MQRLLLVTLVLAAPVASAQDKDYYVYVAAESADEVYRLKFDGSSAVVDKVIQVGYQPTEIEGPHGLAVGLDGKYWYLSIAHGKPFGIIYKYETATDKIVGECEVGMFPATMQISPATGLLYCVNFNLHGRMLPSSISILDPEEMVEVARTTTGPMPHGSRVSPDGLRHYSCAMMSGHLFEIDALTFGVKRRLQLDEKQPEGHDSDVKPTWVHPHPKRPSVYCALNGAAQIAEVDLKTWRVVRRFKTAKGPYNLEITPDGKKLVVSYKTAGKVGIWDLDSGREVARLKSTRRVTHGVLITPDGRYGFVSSEGIGSEKGAVDVLDLTTNKKVASVDIGLQAGGIAFWKSVVRGN